MRSRLGLQLLVLLLVIGMWDFIALRNSMQVREIERGIGDAPVLIYSYDKAALDRVAAAVHGQPFYETHRIDAGNRMADDLIQRYGLQASAPILKRYALPNLLRLFVRGDRFGYTAKDRLWKIIHGVDPNLVIDYNEDLWRASVRRLTDFRRSAMMFDVFAALVFLLAAAVMRWVLEHRQNEYWRVYVRSGGDWGRRRRGYLTQVTWLVPVAMLLSIAACAAARWFLTEPGVPLWPVPMSYLRLFALQAAALLLAQWIGYHGVRERAY